MKQQFFKNSVIYILIVNLCLAELIQQDNHLLFLTLFDISLIVFLYIIAVA